jgi:UDP-N-acetylmuramate--alanine ligase
MIVANCEDENTMKALEGEERPMITFGVESGDIWAENLEFYYGLGRFDVVYHGRKYAHIELSVPGMHNVKNALAAAAAAAVLGVPGEAVERGMSEFRLPGRRFERKGFVNGAVLYDDYAHHPGELEVLLDSAAQLGHQRVICAFQPHTYTRTHELFDDFVKVLKKPDVTLVAEIYAARDENTIGISSNDLVKEIPGSIYCPTLEDVAAKLKEIAQPGDLVLTVGAGDIYLAGEMLV